MQRDLKIGLSLAVLLLGVVGALFFRRDDTDLAQFPELQTSAELNHKIAEKSRIPYLEHPKPSVTPPRADMAQVRPTEPRRETVAELPADMRPSTPVVTKAPSTGVPVIASTSHVDSTESRNTVRNPSPSTASESERGEPSATPAGQIAQRRSPPRMFIPPTQWSPFMTRSPAGVATADPPVIERTEPRSAIPASTVEETPTRRTHVVRRGETLERIAREYYRDPRRVDEIYQANQDILESPHRLSEGLELVIP